ncbi:DinB family protein [soil metagenome]
MPERQFPDLWVDPADDPRDSGGPPLRGERAVVLDYLRHFRMTFEMKCADLDDEQLARRSVPPSSMSLLGLVRHLAKVEHSWARRVVQGDADLPRLYRSEADRDLDFNGAVADPAVVADAWASWRREVAHAEALYAGLPLDRLCSHPDGELEVREVLVHLVEEYARHCGHADLLRECVDGRTGQ